MKFKHYFRAATLTALIAFGGFAQAGGEGWTSDFKAAQEQAAKEKKSLLIDFTGSDWCGWCIKLNKEVFVHDAFKNGVKDKFVLVELDYPRDKSKLTEEVIAQNKELKEKYSIRGYPTILATDEKGRPFARTGYRPNGPEAYVEHLNEILTVREKRDAAFAEAEKATGVAKANILIAAIKDMELDDAIVSTFYADVVESIKAADPKDETGYLKEIEKKKIFSDFQDQINELGSKKDFEGAIKVIDEALAAGKFEGELKQQALIFKAVSYVQLKKPEDAIKALDEVKAVDPENEVSKEIESFRKRVEASIPKPKPEPEAEVKPEAKPE